jgi:hypothetical protein
MTKKIIELKVHNWSKLTLAEQRSAAKWLKELASELLRIRTAVHDKFTGNYP